MLNSPLRGQLLLQLFKLPQPLIVSLVRWGLHHTLDLWDVVGQHVLDAALEGDCRGGAATAVPPAAKASELSQKRSCNGCCRGRG